MVIVLYRDDTTGVVRAFTELNGASIRQFGSVAEAKLMLNLESMPLNCTWFALDLDELEQE